MSTLEERRKNAAKVRRHYHRHRVRLRHEAAEKRRLADAWKLPQAGRWSVAIRNGRPCVTASTGLVGGLTASAAKRICAGLRKLLGVKPEPKMGSPVWLVREGKAKWFCSLTEAGAALGVHRSTIQRNMRGGGDCASCGGWTDDADFTDYAGSEAGVGGSDCTILRGCQCDPST